MKKNIIALSLTFSFTLFATDLYTTMDLFRAIELSDLTLFNAVLAQGVDVNVLNTGNGRTPLMLAIEYDLRNKTMVNSIERVAKTQGIANGFMCGFLTAIGAYFATAHFNHVDIGMHVMLMISGMISIGCMTGYFIHLHAKKAWSYNIWKKRLENGEAIIYALCNHPGIDLSIKEYPTGATVGTMLAEILKAKQQLLSVEITLFNNRIMYDPSVYQTIYTFYSKLAHHLSDRITVPISTLAR